MQVLLCGQSISEELVIELRSEERVFQEDDLRGKEVVSANKPVKKEVRIPSKIKRKVT